MYIVDTSNNAVRRVSGGTISTEADQLLSPWNAAVSPTGDVYVADTFHNRILKISQSGQTSIFAPGTQLNQPHDVAVDTAGNIFILDSGNNRVLKATPDGKTTLYAGVGLPGFFGDGGPATQARLNFPYGIALDASGDLFISDSLNQRIRIVTPDQNIDTLAGINQRGYNGDRAPLGTAFNYPAGLAVDSSGTLYIADTGNHLVRKIVRPLTANAQVVTIAGSGVPGFSGDLGLAKDAQLSSPYGVAADFQGNVLIADSGNHRIRKIDVSGIITTVAGSDHAAGDGGPANLARLFAPSGIAIDSSGNIYVADSNNNRVRRIATDGTITTTVTNLNSPNGLAFDNTGALYIADTNANVIRKVFSGSITTVAGIDGEAGNNGDEGLATMAHLEAPNAVAFDKAGNMYIADSGNNRIRVINRDGRIRAFAGDSQYGLPGFSGDGGPAASAMLRYPRGLAVDSNDNLYIADFFNDCVRMVSAATRNIKTVAGTQVRGAGGDGGLATQAQLALPSGLAFDNFGNLYIADSLNNRIRALGANGILTSVAGGNGAGDAGDGGPALGALLATPRDLAVDAKGIVYFSDQDNNRVRKLVPGLVIISQVVNAASNAGGGVAPGETITLYGSQLAPDGVASFVPASAVALATTAANTQVFFDGIPAPLTYISPGQINAVVPYEVAGHSSTSIVVLAQGRRSNPFTIPVVPAAPGVFVNPLSSALNQDGSQNTATNPAHIGDIIVLFVTGEGQTIPPGVTGRLAIGTLPIPALPVTVQIGGQTATLVYAGALPTGAGVMQINAIVPDGITLGDRIPIRVAVGSAQAQSGVSLSVR